MSAHSLVAMAIMVSGWAISFCQASQAASMMSFVSLEEAVVEPVGAKVLPDILDGVELRGARRQEDHGDVARDREVAGGVPAGAVEQQAGVSALGDGVRDLARWNCMASVSA